MMERALKERIIGAVVLVLFVVLVVPIFLDGPPEEGEIVSERVLLPGQEEQKTQTVVLDRDRTEPVPVASTLAPAREETADEEPAPAQPQPAVVRQPEPEPAKPEPTPEPVVEKQPAASATGMWAVQLGSFSNKDNAEKLAADLRKQGYAAFLSQLRRAADRCTVCASARKKTARVRKPWRPAWRRWDTTARLCRTRDIIPIHRPP